MRWICCLLLLSGVAGCGVPSTFRKTVTVMKDPEGRIQSIKVEEEIIQSYEESVKEPKYLDQ